MDENLLGSYRPHSTGWHSTGDCKDTLRAALQLGLDLEVASSDAAGSAAADQIVKGWE